MGISLRNMNENSRAGSLAKSYLNSASKQESKVVLDKNAQTTYVDNIYNYLLDVAFEARISAKVLRQPSSKIFFSIFNHLINTIDPHLLSKNTLTEDKFPMIVKYIGYPYLLPKAVFVALTAPHTWPHLLCLLSWMVDLVKYRKIIIHDKSTNYKLNLLEF